ncbi:transglycosylase domain-containing protein, partial [Atlantibacter subterraneus]
PARVVVTEEGTPLWRFADDEGIWRYPVTIEEVSPRYLDALIHYEDRWFWKHPGINPFSIARAAWQGISAGRVVSGGSTLTMQV